MTIGRLPAPKPARHGICRVCNLVMGRSDRHCASPNCIWRKPCFAANEDRVRKASA